MGKFNSAWLLGRRQFRFLTGVKPSVYRRMVEQLRPLWRNKFVAPKNRAGRPWGIGGLEDHLVVLLILYRCAVTQDFLGCLYRVDKSAICWAMQRIEPLARRTVGVKRRIRVSREEAEALIIDCTEQPIQRPRRKQRCWYSGKKKRHTIKTEIVVTEKDKIVGVSDGAPGRVHDLEVRRRGPPLPEGSHAYLDSGYQGLQRTTTPASRYPTNERNTVPSRPTNVLIIMPSAAIACASSTFSQNSSVSACWPTDTAIPGQPTPSSSSSSQASSISPQASEPPRVSQPCRSPQSSLLSQQVY
jgi:hypothetical protein